MNFVQTYFNVISARHDNPMSVCVALSLVCENEHDDDQTLSRSTANELEPVLVVYIKGQLCRLYETYEMVYYG